MASTLPRLPILEALSKHDPASPSIIHSDSGHTFSYGNLLRDVSTARDNLHQIANGKSLDGARVAFIIETSYDYVVTYLSVLAANAVAVPLAPSFPSTELRYIVNQAQVSLLLSSPKNADKAKEVLSEDIEGSPIFHQLSKISPSDSHDRISLTEPHAADKAGMMLYTSGTTSRPKGVLLPNSTITAQARSLIEAWDYSPKDRLLHVLPLHHIHGTINALLTPLFAGSSVEFAFPFHPDSVWRRFAAPFSNDDSPSHHKTPVTFFTAVPTIYSRLLTSFSDLPDSIQAAAKKGIATSSLRLNISGSAALPTPTKKKWSDLSDGNILLERYGMTEVGMALSCGLAFSDRVDGSVGWPLPGVEARLVDTESNEVIPAGSELEDGKVGEQQERQGEIQLRGATVFQEYWRNEEATAKERVAGDDGKGPWFKTGDVAVRRRVPSAGQNSAQKWASGPMYFIQGRKSADIIKSGGEKVSALEVEREMLSLDEVAECAVVGVPNPQWGQKVSAVVVLTEQGKTAGKGGKAWSPLQMRGALKERLVTYKVPQDMKVVESIPRNAMGKINKKELVKSIWPDAAA